MAKKATAYAFYRLIQRISRVKIPAATGDFRLLIRRALDALKQLREQHRFMKGLFAWIGFPGAGGSIVALMQLVSHCDALIFDVRRNGGGEVEAGWRLEARGQIDGTGTSPKFTAKDEAGASLADEQLDSSVKDGGAALEVLAGWLRQNYGGSRVLGVVTAWCTAARSTQGRSWSARGCSTNCAPLSLTLGGARLRSQNYL